MLAWLLAASLATPTVADCAPDPALRLGSSSPQIEVFFDPVAPNGLHALLEVRRWVAERPAEAAARVYVVGTRGQADHRALLVRRFALAMANAGRFVEALRLILRDGTERTYLRIVDPTARPELAQELSLSEARFDELLTDRCTDAALRTSDAIFRRKLARSGSTFHRLPAAFLGDELIDDGVALDKVRVALDRAPREVNLLEEGQAPGAPTRTLAEPLRRDEVDGARYGGPGLPHEIVLLVRGEDDPNLAFFLPKILAARRIVPGRLSVRIVARGSTVAAMTLRERLCISARTGSLAGYVDYLETDPSLRGRDPVSLSTLAALDATDDVVRARCERENTRDPAADGLPDGVWLDGTARTRTDIDTPEALVRLLRVRSPWSVVLPREDVSDDEADGR